MWVNKEFILTVFNLTNIKELQLWEKEQEELKRKVKKIKDADTKIRLADIAQRQRIVSNDDDDFLNYQKDLRTIYKGDMKRLGNGD